MELHDPDTAIAYEALIFREGLTTRESLATAGATESLATDEGYEDDNLDHHSAHSELLERRASAVLREGDREPVMHRSFSPLAGLALGFRSVSLNAEREN